MGNIQSFNNFASTITNTFSLPFINKMLKKNNLQKITMKQYSQLKNEGFKKKDILQLKSLKSIYSQITKEEYKKLKENNFGFEEILVFIRIKKQYSHIQVDHYINYNKYFKTSEEILEFIRVKHIDRDLTVGKYNDYLEGKKLDRDLTIGKYNDYLKQLKTSEDVIKYLTFNTKYPQNNLTVKEYKDILHHNLKLTDDDIESLIKEFGTSVPKMVDFGKLKSEFTLFTVDEYKKLLDKNYTLKEMGMILFLKTYNVLTDDEIQRLIKEFGTDVQKMVDFVLLKKDFRLFTVDEYKSLLTSYQPREIRKLLQKRQKQQQKKQIDKLILQENQAMIQKLKTKTAQERNEMNRKVTDELKMLKNQKSDGYIKRLHQLGTLKKNIQSLAQTQERRRISRSSKTSQRDIDQID